MNAPKRSKTFQNVPRNFVHKDSEQKNRPVTHKDQKKEQKKSGVRDQLRQGVDDWRNWAQ